MRANRKPYGRDFLDGKPTGRFCNGRIPSDLLVEILGIKEALPPYLDPNLKIEDLLTGVCFASAGTGFDPLTVKLASVISAEDQLKMFQEYIGKLQEAVGKEKTALILAKSIIVISMGSNDIAGTYFASPFRRFEYNVEEYTSLLINSSSNFVQELYKFGARRIGVLGLSPIGCVPLQRTLEGGPERDCVKSINEAAIIYNTKLTSSLEALSISLPKARLVYLENYNEFNEIIQHYNELGFEVADSACCGGTELVCGPLALTICKDDAKYVFWDSYHPTDRTYSMVVSKIAKRDLAKFFK
uniref:GDSL esterase/lipase EXL3 n=2 Tax=Cajanus cajan TaxID=3821 RepID=A0A151R885_CAJCA|nr:GDSL esterase/lipase EXL3 [Cajanus cajan]